VPTGYATVQVNPQGLTAGQYQGSFQVNTSSGTQQVTVNLNVTNGTTLNAIPGTINVSGSAGSSPSGNFTILTSDNSVPSASFTPSASWITINTQINSVPSSGSASFNTFGLCNGLNSGTISVSAPGAVNNPLVIPVVVNVSNSTATNCSGGGGGT